MAETVHNWDTDALKMIMTEIERIKETLSENEQLLESEGFSLMTEWQGRAGKKIMLKTISNAGGVEQLITGFSELKDQLGDIITKCYEPCEQELAQRASKLLGCR